MTKFNPDGSALIYSTYLGGSASESAGGIALDSAGNAYVTGYTDSFDFPTMNAIQPSFSGGEDAFITKINANGTALVYSTYLGGSGTQEGWGIAVDSGAGLRQWTHCLNGFSDCQCRPASLWRELI